MQPTVDRELLENMLVLELTASEAGATCTQTLAWLGARVIKIEPPGSGEPGRKAGRLSGKSTDSVFFVLHNTNKQSITLDIHHTVGRELFRQLIRRADVVVNNLPSGAFERLGWSYPLLQEVNSSIIYATISGFGSTGPYSDFPCTEAVAEAMGGGLGTTGFPGRPPTLPWSNAGESGAGLHAALAILAAFADRMDTGRSHHVEVSMQEAVVNLVRTRLFPSYDSGEPYPRLGNWLLTVPGDTYPCKPGGPNDYVYVFVLSTAMWEGCLRAMGREDLIGDERYQEISDRLEHREEVETMFTAWTRTLTKHEVLEALCRQGVPCGAVLDTAELMANTHLEERRMMVQIEHPEYGPLRLPGCPIQIAEQPVTLTAAPLLGADNAEVYGRLLSLDVRRLQELRAQGVI